MARTTAASTWRISDAGMALRTVGQLCLLILALLLMARALYYAWNTVSIVRWPHEAHGGETTMLYESQLLSAGPLDGLRALYGPQRDDRFLAGNYPPVYIALWASEPGPSGLPTGRALSLLGGLVAAVAGGFAVFAALRREAKPGLRLWAGVLGGATFICTVPVFQQIAIAKPDMTALAFAACGLAAFEFSTGRRGYILAGLCFGLGLLTKQSIGFALAAALVAALRRDRQAFLTLATTVAATLFVVLGALWLITGPSLFEHLVSYNTRPWRDDRFESLNEKFLLLHWPILVPALTHSLWGLYARGRSALTYYPLFALAVLLTVGAEGGARNYYIELCLAAGLGLGLALATLLNSRAAALLPVSAVVLVIAAFYAQQSYTLFIRGLYVPEPPLKDGTFLNATLAIADSAPDPVLSDDINYLAIRNRPAVLDDSFLAMIVRNKGMWQPTGIIAAVNERRYPLIITARNQTDAEIRRLWGDPLVDAIYANYDRAGPTHFLPKQYSNPAPTPLFSCSPVQITSVGFFRSSTAVVISPPSPSGRSASRSRNAASTSARPPACCASTVISTDVESSRAALSALCRQHQRRAETSPASSQKITSPGTGCSTSA